jgi:LMBR1 domain-containing protein 1
MLSWWLILLAVLIGLLIFALSIYFVVLFVAEADRGAAWFPKTVAVLGLSLACILVLLLPFDVATRNKATSFLANDTSVTQEMWEVMLWIVAGFVVVLIPFTTFYYEALDPDDPSCVAQFIPALMYTLGMIIFFGLVTGLSWLFAGFAVIPYWAYSGVAQYKGAQDASLVYVDLKVATSLELRVSVFVYITAMLCFFGWILFMFYGGVGVAALPYDLIMEFVNRPKPISKPEFDTKIVEVATRAKLLLEEGKLLDREQRTKNNSTVRGKINEFRNTVMDLEDELQNYIVAYVELGGSPFVTYGKLMLGVLGIGLSILWFLHILLYNATRVHAFLNEMLTALDNAFALLGVVAYAVFAFYLLWCTVHGCIKIGMRLVFFTVHPMKVGDTLMNSMLFNVGLILLTSVTVVQFCGSSFELYASNTSIDGLLNLYVRRLRNIGLAIWYFQFFFLAIGFISIAWIVLCPRKKREDPRKGGPGKK